MILVSCLRSILKGNSLKGPPNRRSIIEKVLKLQTRSSVPLGCVALVLRINGLCKTPIKVGWIRPIDR